MGKKLSKTIEKIGGSDWSGNKFPHRYYVTTVYEKIEMNEYVIVIQMVNMFKMGDNQIIYFNQEQHKLLNTHSQALPSYLLSILGLNKDGEPYLKLPENPAWNPVAVEKTKLESDSNQIPS